MHSETAQEGFIDDLSQLDNNTMVSRVGTAVIRTLKSSAVS